MEDVHETLRRWKPAPSAKPRWTPRSPTSWTPTPKNAALAELAELEKLEMETAKETVDRKKTVDGVTNSHEQVTTDHGPRSVKDVGGGACRRAPASRRFGEKRSKRSKTISREDEDEEEEPLGEPSRVAAS